jgi:hypothetical protein
MMIHLAAQCPFDQRLLERQRRGVDGFGRHRTVAELLEQLGRNRRQCRRLGFRFARHTLSLGACYALNTKFLTGPFLGVRQCQQVVTLGGGQDRTAWHGYTFFFCGRVSPVPLKKGADIERYPDDCTQENSHTPSRSPFFTPILYVCKQRSARIK